MTRNVNKKSLLMLTLLVAMTVLISCKKDDPAPPSTVNAAFSSEVDLDNSFMYSFTNNTVILGIKDLTATYAWDFGGEGTSAEKDPSHTFSAAGDYTVTLTVTAADGETGSASETITVTAPLNKWAAITDLHGTGGLTPDDTGELRKDFTEAIQTGRLTFKYMSEESGKDGFISLCGSSTTGDLMIAEVRLRSAAGGHEWREGNPPGASTAFPIPRDNEWIDVEMSWAADGTNAPTFSLTIDGVSMGTGLVSTTNDPNDVAAHLEAVKNGLNTIQWKYNSNSAVDDKTYSIDDIKVYSSDSGSEVMVFSDDFQGYQTGTDLNPGIDLENPTSPYHVNSIDATVAEEN